MAPFFSILGGNSKVLAAGEKRIIYRWKSPRKQIITCCPWWCCIFWFHSLEIWTVPPHQDVHPLFICGCLAVWRGPCLDHLLYDWGSRMFTAAYGAFSVHVFRKAMLFNSDSASFPSYENTINTFSVGSEPNFPACHLWSGHIHFTPVPLSIELIISPWGLGAS